MIIDSCFHARPACTSQIMRTYLNWLRSFSSLHGRRCADLFAQVSAVKLSSRRSEAGWTTTSFLRLDLQFQISESTRFLQYCPVVAEKHGPHCDLRQKSTILQADSSFGYDETIAWALTSVYKCICSIDRENWQTGLNRTLYVNKRRWGSVRLRLGGRLSDDSTVQSLLTSPWVWCHHCSPLQMNECVVLL